jgi:hypothetical protein
MEWLYWITLFVGAAMLSTGWLALARGRRRERVLVHETTTDGP